MIAPGSLNPGSTEPAQHLQLAACELMRPQAAPQPQAIEIIARTDRHARSALTDNAARRFRIVGMLHGDSTAVSRRNVTPCASASHAASRGIACRDSTRKSMLLSRTADRPGAAICGQMCRAACGVSRRQPSAISVAMKASSTSTASGRRTDVQRPVCKIGMPAALATSCQTSRLRRARDHIGPRSCPVTVTKPKLRTDAPLAWASRSITILFADRAVRAASAVASPTMPAPTTARSNRSSVDRSRPRVRTL